MEGLQIASSIYAPFAEISSPATDPERLQPMEPTRSQCKTVRVNNACVSLYDRLRDLEDL